MSGSGEVIVHRGPAALHGCKVSSGQKQPLADGHREASTLYTRDFVAFQYLVLLFLSQLVYSTLILHCIPVIVAASRLLVSHYTPYFLAGRTDTLMVTPWDPAHTSQVRIWGSKTRGTTWDGDRCYVRILHVWNSVLQQLGMVSNTILIVSPL